MNWWKMYGDKVGMWCVHEQSYVQHPRVTPPYISYMWCLKGRKQCFNLALHIQSDWFSEVQFKLSIQINQWSWFIPLPHKDLLSYYVTRVLARIKKPNGLKIFVVFLKFFAHVSYKILIRRFSTHVVDLWLLQRENEWSLYFRDNRHCSEHLLLSVIPLRNPAGMGKRTVGVNLLHHSTCHGTFGSMYGETVFIACIVDMQ